MSVHWQGYWVPASLLLERLPMNRQRNQNGGKKKRQTAQGRPRRQAVVRARRGLGLRGAGNAGKVRQIAAMIKDPCMGPTVAPEYGGSQNGYVSRFKKTFTIGGGEGSTGTAGYLVWFPDFQGGNNLYLWSSSTDLIQPVNTGADPLGYDLPTSGRWLEDPAKPWVAGDAVEDGRLAAACMKLSYAGAMAALKGRVATISGISRDQLLHGGDNGSTLSASVLLNLASNTERFQTAGAEIRARPGEPSQYYRTSGGPPRANHPHVAMDNKDNCFDAYISTSGGCFEPLTGPSAGNGIAVCWTGVDPAQAIVIELYKVLEWRPKAVSGIVQKQSSSDGENLTQKAVGLLDRVDYAWQSAKGMYSQARRGGGFIADIAATGMIPGMRSARPILSILDQLD